MATCQISEQKPAQVRKLLWLHGISCQWVKVMDISSLYSICRVSLASSYTKRWKPLLTWWETRDLGDCDGKEKLCSRGGMREELEEKCRSVIPFPLLCPHHCRACFLHTRYRRQQKRQRGCIMLSNTATPRTWKSNELGESSLQFLSSVSKSCSHEFCFTHQALQIRLAKHIITTSISASKDSLSQCTGLGCTTVSSHW